jgi:hypothetical protein
LTQAPLHPSKRVFTMNDSVLPVGVLYAEREQQLHEKSRAQKLRSEADEIDRQADVVLAVVERLLGRAVPASDSRPPLISLTRPTSLAADTASALEDDVDSAEEAEGGKLFMRPGALRRIILEAVASAPPPVTRAALATALMGREDVTSTRRSVMTTIGVMVNRGELLESDVGLYAPADAVASGTSAWPPLFEVPDQNADEENTEVSE